MAAIAKIKLVKLKPRSGTAVAAQHRNSAGPMRDRRDRRSNEPTDWLDFDEEDDVSDDTSVSGSL